MPVDDTASAGVGSALPSQVGVTSGYALTTDGTVASWASVSGGSGVTTMAAVGSSPSANAASISGVTLTMQPADATHPGVVTTAAQTFGGAKTVSGFVSATGDPTVATGSAAVIGFASGFAYWCSVVAGTVYPVILADATNAYLNAPSASGTVSIRTLNNPVAVLSTTSLDLTGMGTGGSIKLKDTVGGTVRTAVITSGVWVIT